MWRSPARFVEILKDFLRTTEPTEFDSKERRDLLRQGPRNEAVRTSSTSADPPSQSTKSA